MSRFPWQCQEIVKAGKVVLRFAVRSSNVTLKRCVPRSKAMINYIL